MGKEIILYQSKYGATKKYAKWLNDGNMELTNNLYLQESGYWE